MSNDSNVSSSLEHSDSSDSDEDLDAPEYSKIFSKRSADEAFQAEEPKYSSPQKVNRLDSLLSDHLKEAAERSRLEKVREELLQDIHNDSREELQPHSQSLASEHEDHLQQLDVKSSEQLAHPGIKLFNVEKLCCLYSERTSLFAYGFTSSGSAIDKILANTATDSLSTLLLSKAIVTCMQHISDLKSVLIWLLNILAVHSSPVTVHSCYNNLIGTLHQFKVSSLGKSSGPHISWCPHPLALMRIFVNLGARAEDLLGKEHKYSQDEIRKFLTVENDENVECKETPKGQLQKENVQMVYKVMALALQTKPSMAKEDLTQIFFMLAKVELDNHINRSISLEAQECFSAILQCYSEEDWSSEVSISSDA
ncbi:smc5-smc6 complex localization factor protein 2 [Plakobranchus ocellatus]|uniref:Smc5-smc6 complex localization factor protein 2 n=1 Tax=Plakobranchus ocellatus TaxID=259542 RepID=A0AAV3YTY2_9GAST|nr:smc5-smc6 complex localization factor protein 2 [Plakobranchus ocellatus]